MREIKEILILIRENKSLNGTFSRPLIGKISGLCDIAAHLCAVGVINENELNLFGDFMLKNKKITDSLYWWPTESLERWEWLDEQIEKL